MDLNGKGGLSVLSGSNCCDTCGFYLFRRADDGSWEPRRRLKIVYPKGHKQFAFRNVTFVSAADWDGDGVADLLTIGLGGRGLFVARGPLGESESVEFAHPFNLPRGADGAGTDQLVAFAAADWDRDGKPGLLVHRMSEDRSQHGVYWYKSLGGPGLQRLAPGKLVLDLPKGQEIDGFCVADWNGDGWPDLITTRSEYTGKNPDGSSSGWRSAVRVHLRE